MSATCLSIPCESCHWVLSKWVLWLFPLKERRRAEAASSSSRSKGEAGMVGGASGCGLPGERVCSFAERCRCCFFDQVPVTPTTRAPDIPPPPNPPAPWLGLEPCPLLPSGQESPLQPPSVSSCSLATLPVTAPAAGSFHSSGIEPRTFVALHLHVCQQAEMCSNLGTLSKAGIIPLK